jgi:hypothetical protein
MGRSKNKRRKQLLQAMSMNAEEHNCKITTHDFCANFVIGLDENRKTLFFFKETGGIAISRNIALNKIKHCQILNTSKSIKGNQGTYREIDKLGFSFIPTARNSPSISLEIYDYEESLPLSGELQLIDKWVKNINNILKPINHEEVGDIAKEKEKMYTAQVI